MDLLGLVSCKNSLVGDGTIRGISGGQVSEHDSRMLFFFPDDGALSPNVCMGLFMSRRSV